ncbi:MAG: protein-glutamate O-methyltransferase [Syntrophobacteraceae bacterium]|nr:protein-glutamate O-methyltransferase [Syntrophobacteraceae bacterium]
MQSETTKAELPRRGSSSSPADTNGSSHGRIFSAQMSDRDYHRLSKFIHDSCGITLPPAKKTMIEGRLRKRLRALGIESFGKYCEFVFDSGGMQSEHIHMIDVVTTNKTDFFREPDHFDYLTRTALPQLMLAHMPGARKKVNIWSAACSTGEEPYTLAMVLGEFAEVCPGFDFSILATDISTEVLEKARLGIYDHDRAVPIPMVLRKKYLLKSRQKEKGLVRVTPELRNCVKFRRLNFLERDYGIEDRMDVVFCRNALIYFDRPTQERLVARFLNHMAPGGFLFVGHSESLHGMDLSVEQTATTVYRKL